MQGFSSAAEWAPPTGTLGMLTAAAHQRADAVAGTIDELKSRARDVGVPLRFASALRGAHIAVITEIKRSSPSKGAIALHLDAVEQAERYVAGGASAISVLTEPSRFGGSLDDLRRVTERVRVPALRKDFIVHPVQLWEARVYGASAALLIVRALAPHQLETLMQSANEAGIETLVEIRDEAELERALAVGAKVIGVNNRNLETLEIDPTTAPRVIAQIPSGLIAVAESGMTSAADVEASRVAGADAILVGSAISASSGPERAVRALANIPRIAR